MTDEAESRSPRLRPVSAFGAIALAFGCAVGWGSLFVPASVFLPKAGSLGTTLGIVLGALAMLPVAWCYHYMTRRHPGPGGPFSYVLDAFGGDNAFLCGWFLVLAYLAIAWANATALTIAFRNLFGDTFSFGFNYTIAGYTVCLGDLAVSTCAIAIAAAICQRTHLASRAVSVLAVVFAVTVVVVFCAAAWRFCVSGAPAPAPFAESGIAPFAQVLQIVALAPWLYIGFEGVCHLSGEFGFPRRRSFTVMAVALAVSVVAYIFLALLPAISPASANVSVPVFGIAKSMFGRPGTLLSVSLAISAVFTNIVGDTLIASRLVSAMASKGALPRILGVRSLDGVPKNAILFIAAVSLFVPALGRTAIGFIVDVATIGAAIAYAYTSAAALKTSFAEKHYATTVAAICGILLSVAMAVLFLIPGIFAGTTFMAAESYLILALWSIAGICVFLFAFRRDSGQCFGRSPLVWISLLGLVLMLSVFWVRQSTSNSTAAIFAAIADGSMPSTLAEPVLRGAILRNSIIQTAVAALAFGLLAGLYAVLRRRERELEDEKARAKSYFFSTVSHDIRTPLNAIIGYSELLRDDSGNGDNRKKAVDSIIMSGKTLLGLVNDILDLSRLELGKMDVVPEPTDVATLLKGVVDAFRARADLTAVELRCRADGLPCLMVDPQRLRQIAFNLLGNAVKFTRRGYVELRAVYSEKDGVFTVSVEDTGCGISEEDCRRIASPYVQVGSRGERNGGTGLGLAICKQLADAMGGKFSVKSQLGRGSVFTVSVPGVKRAAEKPSKECAQAPRAVSHSQPKPADRMRRILLVDDVRVNLLVLKALIERIGGYEATIAGGGREALEAMCAAGGKTFDLVLTDMWMPDIDGDALLRKIRADSAFAHTKVVAVTADVELKDKADAQGFDGIILKPVTMQSLTEALAQQEKEP